MTHPTHPTRGPWPAANSAAMVGADPARDTVQTVEGPTLHDREIEFGRGIASGDRSPTCTCRSSRAYARSNGPGRSIRAVLLAAAVGLLVAGCGGGDDAAAVDAAVPVDPAAGTDPAMTDPAAAGGAVDPATGQLIADDTAGGNAPGATEEIPGANEISNADAATGQTVKISALTPKKFVDAHCAKPIMVVLYQPDSILDERLYTAARKAAKRSKLKDLVTLAYNPREVKEMGDLPSKLGLLATPGIATVGRDGTIENFWTTYVDEALIAASLKNAGSAKPCKLSAEEVPAAGSALADATTVANGGTLTDAAASGTVEGTTTDPLAGAPPATPAVDAAGAATGF